MLDGKRLGFVGTAAVLGGLAGFAMAAPRAAACDCAGNAWQVTRTSVTSSGRAESHERFWPVEGTLSAYPGHASIWFTQRVPETIHAVTTTP